MKLNEVDLHITNRCNLKCKTCCYTSNELELYEMTTEEAFSVIDSAVGLGCLELHISGGEPLLRSDLLSICQYAIGKGLEVRLQTNGILLTPEKANELRTIGIKELMISLDGSCKGIMDPIRGNGSFAQTINAIKLALDYCFDVRVNAVVTSYNSKDIINIIQLCHLMGVRKFSCFYFSPIGRGKNNFNLWLNPQQYLNFWSTLSHEIATLGYSDMDIVIEKAYATKHDAAKIDVSGFTGCGGGCGRVYYKRDYLIVRCDGNIYPCILMIDGEPLGNIFVSSIKDIWTQSNGWSILQRPTAYCKDCNSKQVCNAGCAGYAKILANNWRSVDPRCIKNEIVPLCPIMKYNFLNQKLGGSSSDVLSKE